MQMNKNKNTRGFSEPKYKTIKINKEKLNKSKIGLFNAGGSCYMSSIIQILIHLEKFLDYFKKSKESSSLI